MTSSIPWSVKGIDAKARERAKELARRSGMTLGEWLNERIKEDGGAAFEESADAASRSLEDLASRIQSAEQRSTLAVTGIDQSVRGMLARMELAEREQTAVGARFEGALQETQALQGAIDARLRKLESEAAGPRSAEALKSLEAALGRVANHLYDGEARTRETIADVRRELAQLAARVDRADADRGQAEAGGAARLVERLNEAENRTMANVRTLEASFNEMSRRLAEVEQRPSGEVDAKLDAMASKVAKALQATRAEMTRELRAAVDGDRMDQALLTMTAHVQAAERRSAQAMEKMGQEVLKVADVLNRRVQGVETRSLGAVTAVGGELARAVEALESRAGRTEAVQAESLEKMGGEIARVTERLADRITAAERRSAQAVDDINDKLSLTQERLNQRHERATGDLAERIRASEERTQRLLEEARERIDRRVSESVRPSAPAPFQHYAEPASFADTLDAPAFPGSQPFPGSQSLPGSMAERNAAAGRVLYPDAAPFGHTYAPAGFTPVEPEYESRSFVPAQTFTAQTFTTVEPEFDDGDIEAAQDFATPLAPQSEADFVDVEPEDEAALQAQAAEDAFIAAEATEEVEELLAEQVEEPLVQTAASQAAPFAEDPIRLAEPPPPAPDAPVAPRILTTRELVEQARAAARAASEESKASKVKADRKRRAPVIESTPLGAVSFGSRRRPDNTVRTALFATFGGAVLLIGGAGAAWLMTPTGDDFQKEFARAWNGDTGPVVDTITPRVAVALDPKPIDRPAAAAGPRPSDPTASALYREGQKRIEAKDNGGLEPLRQAANLGHPAAQYYLGRLYDDGGAGLAKSPIEARRWFERAAAGGETKAMHDLALMYYQGAGGPQNLTVAADWFKRAAELGLADLQYNIGRLYEDGVGLKENDAEAYKWFLLASRTGTPVQRAEAKAAADRVKATLPAQARATAERVASTFTARSASMQVAAADVDVASVQRALNRLGYYKGEPTGVTSTSLRAAITDFQRDQNITQSGQVDADTALRLSPYMR